ncbi:hypothetical protein [Rudaea sp.]|uniref:hypothetical protein n=1 Tax=Rudaea sp. TaxID=2136325 RepID=UPI00321FB1EF
MGILEWAIGQEYTQAAICRCASACTRREDHKLLHRASVGKTERADYHISPGRCRLRDRGDGSVVHPVATRLAPDSAHLEKPGRIFQTIEGWAEALRAG